MPPLSVADTEGCGKISSMEQPEIKPIHSDGPKTKFNVTLIFALVIAIIGLLTSALFLVILGMAGAGFNWFTSPRRFLIYENALVIIYGQPRVKVILFPEISYLETLVTPMGQRLRVRLVNGRRIMVGVRDIEEFRVRLDEALEKFNGDYKQRQLAEESPENLTPY